MVRISASSKKPPEEVIERAILFFGGQDWGLQLMRREERYALFTAGGGSVSVSVEWDGRRSEVEVVSREWDHAAKEFLRKLR